MADYIEVNLEEVDLSFRLPPVGDYLGGIDTYELRRNEDGTLKDVQFSLTLLAGPAEGIGMKVKDNQDPNHEMGKKKMKMLALACGVPFDAQKINLEPFIGQQTGIRIVHRPGKDKETMFANVSKYFPAVIPGVTDQPSNDVVLS